MWTNQPKIFLICFLPLLSNQFILNFLHICSPKHSQNLPEIYFLQHSLSYCLTFLASRNAAMNSEKCTVCQKKLSDKRSLRRHMQAVHKQYVQLNLFTCDECAFAHEKVVELEAHMEQQHNSNQPRYGLYCNKFFAENLKYKEHMNNNHGLPVWNADVESNRNCGILHTEQGFNGVLRTYGPTTYQ